MKSASHQHSAFVIVFLFIKAFEIHNKKNRKTYFVLFQQYKNNKKITEKKKQFKDYIFKIRGNSHDTWL